MRSIKMKSISLTSHSAVDFAYKSHLLEEEISTNESQVVKRSL